MLLLLLFCLCVCVVTLAVFAPLLACRGRMSNQVVFHVALLCSARSSPLAQTIFLLHYVKLLFLLLLLAFVFFIVFGFHYAAL